MSDVLSAIQSLSVNCQTIARRLNEQAPDLSSGQISAAKLIQVGFVRVTGISVSTAGAAGTLNDAATAALAGAGNVIYSVAATAGFFPVNMVFHDGLVYLPGAAQVATIFYTRL